jgi:hypothetical protein
MVADNAGSPSIPAAAQASHDLAVREGESTYVDPDTGYLVMTAATLLERGYCCGNGCRHCPWPPSEQQRAGRPGS